MIKDILLNLTVGAARDPAVNYAASVATTFDAHLAAIAFAYEPVVPPTIMGGIPASFIDSQRAESEKAAAQAVARFTEVANRPSSGSSASPSPAPPTCSPARRGAATSRS
jgi:hypothetical protein